MIADRAARVVELSDLEGFDDPPVFRDEVRVPLDVAAADHQHHLVHGELAVEAREERVFREVDLVLVERSVCRVPLLVRDRGDSGVE